MNTMMTHSTMQEEEPQLFQQLKSRFYELGKTAYQSDANGTTDNEGAIAAIKDGHWHPWL